MTTSRTAGYIGWSLFGVFLLLLFSLGKACSDGFGYQSGSGLGSLVDIEKEKYQSEYLRKYVDTFFTIYPQYKLQSGDMAEHIASGYEFLDLTGIYFDKYPRESYFVQWSGTGFISVRMAYDYQKGKEVIENRRANSVVADSVKERMTIRFRNEILDKIDDIIAGSSDSVIALRKSPSN